MFTRHEVDDALRTVHRLLSTYEAPDNVRDALRTLEEWSDTVPLLTTLSLRDTYELSKKAQKLTADKQFEEAYTAYDNIVTRAKEDDGMRQRVAGKLLLLMLCCGKTNEEILSRYSHLISVSNRLEKDRLFELVKSLVSLRSSGGDLKGAIADYRKYTICDNDDNAMFEKICE